MSESTSNQTLDIQGTTISYMKVGGKVCGAIVLVGFGFLFWSAMEATWSEDNFGLAFIAIILFIIAAVLPYNKHTYLHFANRHIVTVKYYCGFETSKRCRPLTDFSHIVVRHLCHFDGEGPDTYTGGVGLKPVDGSSVLWVKNFPTTQDEVPRTAYEFATELQEMTGLPVAPMGESKSETH